MNIPLNIMGTSVDRLLDGCEGAMQIYSDKKTVHCTGDTAVSAVGQHFPWIHCLTFARYLSDNLEQRRQYHTKRATINKTN